MIKNIRRETTKKYRKKRKKSKILFLVNSIIWLWIIYTLPIITYYPIRNYLSIKTIQNFCPPELRKLINFEHFRFNIWDRCLVISEFKIKNPHRYIPDYLLKLENIRIKPTLIQKERNFSLGLEFASDKLSLNIYKIPEYGTNIAQLIRLLKKDEIESISNSIILFSEISFSKGEVVFSQSIEPVSVLIQNPSEKKLTSNKYAWEETYIIELKTHKYSEVAEKIVEYSIIKNPKIPQEIRSKFREELLIEPPPILKSEKD
ncbi:MAG: hypothetical protein N3G21_02730 [Candidatus Hydrogenedentes bacterium]|nr:hypothetical protein [Candidatus Hydrogenedentota bacterium]